VDIEYNLSVALKVVIRIFMPATLGEKDSQVMLRRLRQSPSPRSIHTFN